MKIQRTVPEVFSKLRPAHVLHLWRALRSFRHPARELSVFLGIREFSGERMVLMRGGYRLELETAADFRQSLWDCWIRRAYSVRETDRTIIDAGAHIGCFSVYAAVRSPHARVLALEPSSESYRQLQRNVELNGLADRIAVSRLGIAGRSGTRELDIEAEGPYRSCFRLNPRKTESIEVLSLEDVLARVGQGAVDLLKMDCEGAEMECLLAAPASSLARVGRIELEYHEWAGFGFAELRRRLEAAGFSLRSRRHNAVDRGGEARFFRRA